MVNTKIEIKSDEEGAEKSDSVGVYHSQPRASIDMKMINRQKRVAA